MLRTPSNGHSRRRSVDPGQLRRVDRSRDLLSVSTFVDDHITFYAGWDPLAHHSAWQPPRCMLFRLGYFGSYARSDWGVGSDLDLIAIVHNTDKPFEHRALTWDLNALPVPAELLVYTQKEWEKLMSEHSRFAETISREAVWIYP